MDPVELTHNVAKFNRPKIALDEEMARAVRELYGRKDSEPHLSVLKVCNGERLGNAIVDGWRLLSASELVALSAGLSESLEIINDNQKLAGRLVPIFSTSSKCDICFAVDGDLDGQVVFVDVGTRQQYARMAPSIEIFWEAVSGISRIASSEYSGVASSFGFDRSLSDVWKSYIPDSYDSLQLMSI